MDVNDRPVGLSVWEGEYEFLMDHVKSESDVLARYEGLAEQSTGHVRFLLEPSRRTRRDTTASSSSGLRPSRAWERGDGVPDLVHEPDPARPDRGRGPCCSRWSSRTCTS